MTEETNTPKTGEDRKPSIPPSLAAAVIGRVLGGSENRAPYCGSFDSDAIDALKKLSQEASEPKVILVPTAGLEPGLPPQVPIMWDRAMQEPVSLLETLEAARPKMVRKGTATVETLSSFIALVNRHKDANSAIFAATSWPNPKLTAVLDYHTTGHDARWGRHRVEYAFPLTEEFKTWIKGNGEASAMTQGDFANFLEEHAAELAAPTDGERQEFETLFKERFATPAELLDLSRSLEVYVGATVKQGVRPKNGERQMVFVTEHTNANGDQIDIPGIFMVSVAPFVSGDAEPQVVRIPARIRYRMKGQEAIWFYQLYRWEYWLRERVQRDLAFAAQETTLPTYEGKQEMAA
ncbi:DUF2303 family protein [Aquabacter sp. CN5-332]|uniref:DUF2303 family protein n=1 Tax=Aquabacter sp. CN5-332 TaxID=3156608 RepID=UPI0032B4C5B4